jgi:hypothetical protein
MSIDKKLKGLWKETTFAWRGEEIMQNLKIVVVPGED